MENSKTYNYSTPIEAILSLEMAYTNEDINSVFESKDFEKEAIFVLYEASYKYNINDKDLVNETAELLKLSLIQFLQENGFPNFGNAKRKFSELKKINNEIYSINEIISYSNTETYENKYFLSKNNDVWKIITVE